MRSVGFAAAVLTAVLVTGSVAATTTVPEERVCPIGGEKYQSFAIASTSYYGIRLDLQRTGVGAHLPYIECPNGFVVFKDEAEFTAAEIAQLTPVVASERYQAARKSGPPALRMVMLLEALGQPDAEIRGALFRVAFESEGRNEPLRQEYLVRTVAAQEAYMKTVANHDDAWLSAAIRRADLLRQLARFDDSAAATAALRAEAKDRPPHVLKIVAQIEARAKARDAAPAVFKEESE